jgi:hypothetical protein
MSDWSANSAPETVTELVAGDGKFMVAGVSLAPRRTIQFSFSRQDSPTEPWLAEIYASVDDVTYGSLPIATRRGDVADTELEIVVTGPKYVIARIANADGTPTDKVSADIVYSDDGIAF